MLGKALELGLIPIVVINKVDKENCTPDLVQEQVFDLMFNLGHRGTARLHHRLRLRQDGLDGR